MWSLFQSHIHKNCLIIIGGQWNEWLNNIFFSLKKIIIIYFSMGHGPMVGFPHYSNFVGENMFQKCWSNPM